MNYDELIKRIERLERLPTLAYTPLADYSATSTITGWASYTTKKIYYSQVGKLVYVIFTLVGTSNSVSSSFTLPVNANSSQVNYISKPIVGSDNGTVLPNPMAFLIGAGTMQLYTDIVGTNWTASGTKDIRGQVFYIAE